MSFAPITRYGDTTRGQCSELLSYNNHPDASDPYAATDSEDANVTRADGPGGTVDQDADWRAVLLDDPALDGLTVSELGAAGWHVARDGRLLCRRHVAALVYLARAEIDGLPFPTTDATRTGPNHTDPASLRGGTS